MKAKDAEGKTIRGYRNPMLPLMPAPSAKHKEEVPMMVCGFCGGRDVLDDGKPVRINGKRIHPNHKACVESAKHPLFDMSERLLRAR